MTIDWSKAPEYATHWCQRINMFHRDAALCEECIPRPQKPEVEWDGEGLPPVGAELYYVIGDQRYPVTVVGHYDDEVVVFQHESAPDYVGVQPGYLKPQRTKRQRQRDELEDLIHSNLGPECNIEAAAIAIIDAGWKKDA